MINNFRKILRENLLKEGKEVKKLTLYHGVRNSKDVNDILKNGFDLRKIKPNWQNDYAISTLTKPSYIFKFFGTKDIKILKIDFEGVVEDNPYSINVHATTPQEYTEDIVKDGIDAVRLGGDGKQYFIYNLDAIKKITLIN